MKIVYTKPNRKKEAVEVGDADFSQSVFGIISNTISDLRTKQKVTVFRIEFSKDEFDKIKDAVSVLLPFWHDNTIVEWIQKSWILHHKREYPGSSLATFLLKDGELHVEVSYQ